MYRCIRNTGVFVYISVHICDTLDAGCTYLCICINVCICIHTYMDTYVRLWCCLTHWGAVADIFDLCIGVRIHAYVYVCACMCVYLHVHMYVYVHICVCVYVCIYMYTHTHVNVHMHSWGRIWFSCTVQSLYYMRACMCEDWKWFFFPSCSLLALVAGVGGYGLAGVEIGVLSCIILYSCRC